MILLLALLALRAGTQDPVHWRAEATSRRPDAGGTFDVAVTAAIDDEWHLYSVTQGPGGPIPTSVTVRGGQPFSRGGPIRGPEPATGFDPNFGIQTETYEGSVTLVVPVRVAAAAPAGAALTLAVTYQACTDRQCLPPATVTLTLPVSVRGTVNSATPQLPTSNSQPPTSNSQPPQRSAPLAFGASAATWPAFLWLAVTMGALSLLTPCVFPMVPITVSYFTKNAAGSRRAALASSAIYGLGIVLTFTVLGTALSAVAGAAGLNTFAANPWVNLVIAALFVCFALNLFGACDLRLPTGMLTSVDAASRRRGTSVVGTLLMAVTFTMTSLTCSAAFLGTLLVVAAQGDWQRPLAGLAAYSATFALPFVLLAAVPQLVSQLPKSGPWLARVKVAMGFLELAAAVKFLSNADLVWAWGFFSRAVVLVCWTVTMAALAAYLAWPRRPRLGAPALLAALATLVFALWLGRGIGGRPLGELEAFLPPVDREQPWITNDLDAALAEARASTRLVIIDFTGYTCTNCRWMEANMFPRPDVRGALDGFVRARLYTDGQGALYRRQQRYQQEQFRTVALPLYAIVDADRRPIATFAGLTRDSAEFLRFLRSR
jgi:thiol:disulfide interchange protein DsbD